MIKLKNYINENLNKIIIESFESKSLNEFISLSNKKEYEDYIKYGFRVISKITNTYNFSKKQISKGMSLSNQSEEWFYAKDDKKIFNQEEFCNILKISEKDINEAKLKEIAIKNSTCIFLFTENNNSKIKKIIAAMLLDPKHGKDAATYLKEMSKEKETRQNNKSNNDKLSSTWEIDRANKIIKEYNKKASKEQIDLLNETVNKLMKYTNRGKIAKKEAKEFKNSKWYNDEHAHITYYLITSETGEDFLKVFSWTDNLNNKQKDYLSEVVEKLKVK